MTEHTPKIVCCLCDRNGMMLNAYKKNSIRFTELITPGSCFTKRIRPPGSVSDAGIAKILIEGYVAVCIDGRNLSAPVPFSIIQPICICVPENAALKFRVSNFICRALPIGDGSDFIRIDIMIETKVSSVTEKKIEVCDGSSVIANETVDTVMMTSRISLAHGFGRIKAEAYQYTALSDGKRRVYTNQDELKKYGGMGILSPCEVSYYNLYVNGVMQPKVNYIMTKGRLVFLTNDLPTKGATVIIKYVIFKTYRINITDDQYYTISNGMKREYTNDDGLGKYSTNGIPGPDEVSYYNLYVNGVLQPKRNYIIKKGLLKFKTADIPQKGRTIILESVAIKDICGCFLEVEEYLYCTLADVGERAYCSGDNITPYGKGILEPEHTSYQNLMVNAVNQPRINYKVVGDCLILRTVDLPTVGSPVILQSIRVLNVKRLPAAVNTIKALCNGNMLLSAPFNIKRSLAVFQTIWALRKGRSLENFLLAAPFNIKRSLAAFQTIWVLRKGRLPENWPSGICCLPRITSGLCSEATGTGGMQRK